MNTKNIKFTIGGPESPIGSEETREYVIPIRDKPDFWEQVEKITDPAITGVNMAIGEYLAAKDLNGGFPLTPRPCGGFGQIINSCLGQELTPTQIGAVMRFRYGGSEASCKVTAVTSADTLTSEVGALGSESGDTNFGTAGVIDLTDGATDTVTELVAVIAALDDYEAELVTGDGDTDAADIVDITSWQGAGRWVYVFFSSSTSGCYLHQWPVVLTDTARPGYSVQGDGLHENFIGLGVVFDQLSISGALKAMVEADATALGFTWTAGESADTTALETVDPFLFYNGSFSANGVTHAFIRNFSLDIMNNHNSEGYGQSTDSDTSLSRQYHDKGEFSVTMQTQLRYSSDAYALYALITANTQAGVDMYFKTPSVLSGSVSGLMIIEAPYCNVSDYDPVDNSGALDAQVSLKVVNPPGGYGSPFRISMITTDSGTY